VVKLNRENFRVFGPDETASNRWGALFEVTDRMSGNPHTNGGLLLRDLRLPDFRHYTV